jgi:predicted Zn-ribbon and HTH transcriptional regulator
MSDKKRSFSVIYEDKKYLFKGTSPSSVSKKVIIKLCNLYKKKEVKFELNETTKDSKKKKYGPYIGHMEDLKAKVVLVGGKKRRARVRPDGQRGTKVEINFHKHYFNSKAKQRKKHDNNNNNENNDNNDNDNNDNNYNNDNDNNDNNDNEKHKLDSVKKELFEKFKNININGNMMKNPKKVILDCLRSHKIFPNIVKNSEIMFSLEMKECIQYILGLKNINNDFTEYRRTYKNKLRNFGNLEMGSEYSKFIKNREQVKYMLSLKNNLRELQMKLERYSKHSNTKSQSIQDSLLSQIEVVKQFIKNENNKLMVRPASAAALLVKNKHKPTNSIPYNG